MILQVFALFCVLHATIVPAAAGAESHKDLVADELKQDAALAIANNDVKSVKILLSLDVPNLFTKPQFALALISGSDKLVKALLKAKKASSWVSEDKHLLIGEAHKIGRSVPILVKLLKASNTAQCMFCTGSFSSSSSESWEEEDTTASSDYHRMTQVARHTGLHFVAESIIAGTNNNDFTTEAAAQDNSSVLANKILAMFNDALKNQDINVVSLLGNCPAVAPYLQLAVLRAIEEQNYSMIEALCKIPSFNITANNFEAARFAASLQLPFIFMSILFSKGKNGVGTLSVDNCVTVSIENELVSVLEYLSCFVHPPFLPLGLESLSSNRGKHDQNGPCIVELFELALKKPRAVELLQVLFDENRPFIKKVTTNLKMHLFQNHIRDAHKSGKQVLRDQLLKLAIRAHSNLSSGFDCFEFAELATIIRGVDSLIKLSMLGPALNHDLLRELLNNLFDVSFA